MQLKKQISVLLAIILMVVMLNTSCKKDATDNGNNSTPVDLNDISSKVTASANGYVFDELGEPVLNAQVTYGNKVTVTDNQGHFEINNAMVVKNAAVLQVKAVSGYFTATKTAITSSGKTTFFKVVLTPKHSIGSINGANGGVVNGAALGHSDMQIQLPSNAVKNATNGGAYTGTVNITATYIDPTADNLTDIMPGDLRGINTSGGVNGLTTFGMIGVEMTGTGGESLQIADGKTATVTIPLPAAIAANSPSSIPLWHFNETKGLWEEQGTATKVGNTYVGQVSHFSYWNCDLPNAIVPLTFTVVDPLGQPINFAHVEIVPQTSNSWSHIGGYTDSTGYVSVFVTPNTTYQLQVYPNCYVYGGQPTYSQTFTVNTTAIALGNVVVNNNQLLSVVTGRVLDCNNNAVTNGYVYVRNNYVVSRYPLNSLGQYTFSTLMCGDTSTLQITGQDLATGNFSTTYILNAVAGNNSVPDLQACGVVSSKFVNYTIDGVAYSFTAPIDSIYSYVNPQVNPPVINVYATGQSGYCTFAFTQTGMALGSTQELVSFYASQVSDSSAIANNFPVQITEYGNIGEFYSGTFSGTFVGSAGTHTIQASFRDTRFW